jgi:hypothetical protein
MRHCLIMLILALHTLAAHGQLELSEVCSKNVRSVIEPSGATPDWVEVHNSGTEVIDLGGYSLSDGAEEAEVWHFPAIALPPGEFLVVMYGEMNFDGLHFPFKLDGDGESITIRNAALEVVDAVDVPAMRPDHSYARNAGAWGIHVESTPGAPNATTSHPGYAPMPEFSIEPGFTSGPVTITVYSCTGCTVHWTTDGSEPGPTSSIAESAITVDQTTVLKAIAYRAGWLPSVVNSGTYFINVPTKLPVVSLSTHPDSLFDDTLGIYSLGPGTDTVYPNWGANFWEERGISVRFEYFDEGGRKRVDQDVELRIHGGRTSRNKPQRPLRLTARDALGDDLIHHGFFTERPALETFKRIVLRNSGSDWCEAQYRDGFFHQRALHAGLNIDVLAFKPSVVYINGAYWGMMNIRERVDKDHLADNYGADPATLLLMAEENTVIQGDSLHFDSLQQFIRSHDMADDTHWRHVDSLLDLRSFMDYFALEMFSGNSDWPSNNLKYWKPSIHSGKWRYLMYDMDATMAAASWLPNDFDMFYWIHVHREGTIHAEIYQSLIQRPEFRRLFLNRLADLMNTALSPDALLAENDLLRNTIRNEVPRHFQRWSTDPAIWHHQTGTVIPDWARARGEHMRDDVLQWYGLPNTASLHFDVFPPGAASLQVNTLEPEAPFDGIYFNGNDIDVSVEAGPGYTFSHWSYSAEPDVVMKDTHLHRSFAMDGELVAHFSKVGTALYAVPNPTADRCLVSYEAEQAGTLELSLVDPQGRTLRRWKMDAMVGVNRLPVDLSGHASGLFVLLVEDDGRRSALRLMKQ